MKRSLTMVAGAALALFVAGAARTFAADTPVTITGTGMCAKCALHEADTCQNAIQVQKDGKTVTYYLVQNDVSKNFHDNLCKEKHPVKATGTVQDVKGKMELTATKIELVK